MKRDFRRVVLYASVSDRELFSRVGFYRDDILALKQRGADVISTNSLRELFCFRPDLVVGYFYSKAVFAGIIGRAIGAEVVFTGGADQISPALSRGFELLLKRIFAFCCLIVANRILLSCSDDILNFERICLNFTWLKKKFGVPTTLLFRGCRCPTHHHVRKAGFLRSPSVGWER